MMWGIYSMLFFLAGSPGAIPKPFQERRRFPGQENRRGRSVQRKGGPEEAAIGRDWTIGPWDGLNLDIFGLCNILIHFAGSQKNDGGYTWLIYKFYDVECKYSDYCHRHWETPWTLLAIWQVCDAVRRDGSRRWKKLGQFETSTCRFNCLDPKNSKEPVAYLGKSMEIPIFLSLSWPRMALGLEVLCYKIRQIISFTAVTHWMAYQSVHVFV